MRKGLIFYFNCNITILNLHRRRKKNHDLMIKRTHTSSLKGKDELLPSILKDIGDTSLDQTHTVWSDLILFSEVVQLRGKHEGCT